MSPKTLYHHTRNLSVIKDCLLLKSKHSSKQFIRNSVLTCSLLLWAGSTQANVYPTNIKLNGSFTNITVQAGSPVRISYILNEPASAGVVVKVLANGTTIKTISLSGGAAGTLRGTNTVVWDGSGAVASNSYSVAITAASHGFSS